jgi:catechol 2,3-dioxygenase-like lactoylglutathione lyase family enzyme
MTCARSVASGFSGAPVVSGFSRTRVSARVASGFSRTRPRAIHLVLAAVVAMLLASSASLRAQLAPPNAAGVAMGHLHYTVKDVAAHVKFWTALGGRPMKVGATEVIKFPDVLVFLSSGVASGGSDGAVVSHVAFRVPSFGVVEAAGLTVQRFAQFPGVGSVTTPEGERIELFENAAKNLTFTQDSGHADSVAERHNRPLTVPVAFHHIHLYVPENAVAEAKAWYTRVFGGTPGKRSQYDAVDLPGVNMNISSAPKPTTGTKGRMLDHVGFEIRNLDAFCRRLAGMGVTLDTPYAKGADGVWRASLTDPWGTSIELTEGLRGL